MLLTLDKLEDHAALCIHMPIGVALDELDGLRHTLPRSAASSCLQKKGQG